VHAYPKSSLEEHQSFFYLLFVVAILLFSEDENSLALGFNCYNTQSDEAFSSAKAFKTVGV